MNGDQTDQTQIQDPPPAPMMGVAPPMILRGDPSIPRAASVPIQDPTFEERRLRYQIANLPLEQANQAVAAAMKYQGQRGFQADLQAGKSAPEALAKWAPMLFFDHPQAFSGAITKAFTPQTPIQPPTVQTFDGQKFLAIPGKSSVKYQSMKEPKEGSLTQVERDDLRFAERELDKLQAAQERDIQGRGAAGKEGSKLSPGQKALADAFRARQQQIQSYQSRINAYHSRVTDALNQEGSPRVTAPPTGSGSKVQRANALRREHPEWSREQIIAAVNRGE